MPGTLGSISVQGLYNVEVSFTSTITTTSTTDIVLTGMTTTPPAGTYLVTFSTWMTNTTGNQTATISIYAGGVQKASSVMTIVPFSGAIGSVNDGVSVATNGIVTVNGAQAIAIEWHTAGGTASAHNGTMDIVKVGWCVDTEYDFTQTINATQLLDEINTASLPAPDYINTVGTCVSIFYVSALTPGQLSALATVVANHVANPNYITLAVQAQIATLIGYLNNANTTTANTARAVLVANLAPNLPPGMMTTINAQIRAIVGS